MASLENKKIKDTYEGLLKTDDNAAIDGAVEITDGAGNGTGVTISNDGQVTATGTVSFGSLKDTGEDITVTKFVDEADGIGNNDNDTSIPTSAAVKDYVDTNVTAQDLDFQGDTGTGAVDLDSQSLDIAGGTGIDTSAVDQTLTVNIDSTVATLTGTQTLTNKSIDLTDNTLSGTTSEFNAALSDDDFATLTGTETLTNKTVDADNNTVSNLEVDNLKSGVLDTDLTSVSASDDTLASAKAIKTYVDSNITAQDLDITDGTTTSAVDLDSQTLTIEGTSNEVEVSLTDQTFTVGLPTSITTNVTGNLTGNVTGNVTGNLTGNVTGDVTGNADTASALETARTISLSGDVAGSVSFDGSANADITATIQANSVALGTDTTGDYVENLGVGTGVTIGSNTGEGSSPTISVDYGSTANTAVQGDTSLTIQGTANEIEVTGGGVTLGSGGTVTVGLPDDVSLGGSLTIAQNLTVNGTTTTVNTDTLSVEDPLIELARDNSENSVDVGLYGKYSLDSGVTTKYSGLFKDASDSDKFKLFKGLEVEPTSTVDTSGTGYTKGDLVINDLDAVTISGTISTAAQTNITSVGTLSSLDISGSLTINSSSGDTVTISKTTTEPSIRIEGDTNKDFVIAISGELLTITQNDGATDILTLDHDSKAATFTGDLTVDTNTLYVNSSNNRVGIGTASPSDNLEVNGAIRIADQYELKFGGTTASIFGSSSLNQLRFYTNNSERLRIDSSGNVGIGTTSPVSNLHIKDSTSSTDVRIQDSTGNTTLYLQSQNGLGVFGTITNNDLRFDTNDTERMRIDSSGRVGLGTSSPDNAVSGLHISVASSTDQLYLERTGSATGRYYLGAAANSLIIVDDAQSVERLRIDSSGRMGLGTSSPSSQDPSANNLVVEDTAGNGGITVKTPSSAYGSIHFSDGTGTDAYRGILTYNHSDNSMQFSTNASERMRIDSSGNVLVGTDTVLAGAANRGNITINGTSSAILTFGKAGALQGYLYHDGSQMLLNTGTAPAIFEVNGSERMRIDSSGKVGIGTSSPASLLEVFDSNSIGLRFGDIASTPSSQTAGYIGMSTSAYSGNNGDLVLIPRTSSASNILLMEGNVGIGTSSPSSLMHISKSTSPAISNSDLQGIKLTNTSTSFGGSGIGIELDAGNGDVNAMIAVRADGNDNSTEALFIATTTSDPIIFATNSGGTDITTNERMRITSGGDLLIGSGGSEPSATQIGLKIGYASSGTFVNNAKNITTTTAHINFFNPNGLVGAIKTSGSSTSYVTSSDYRLKENVVDMTGALDRVDQLEPKRFNFIADEDTTVDGFLAHQVQDIVPEAVTGEKDAVDEEGNDIYQGIDQSKLVPLLVGAIKELRAEVNSLKAQINN